ncbi:MAG: hypothetical protein ACKVPX_12960 [Myxococcaceae bacterium]
MATQNVAAPRPPGTQAKAEADAALFACAVARGAAFDLFVGLADAQREVAQQQAQKFVALSSQERKRLLRCVFGPRPDAARRCATEVEHAVGVYRVALGACLKVAASSPLADQVQGHAVPKAIGPSIAVFSARRLHECTHR